MTVSTMLQSSPRVSTIVVPSPRLDTFGDMAGSSDLHVNIDSGLRAAIERERTERGQSLKVFTTRALEAAVGREGSDDDDQSSRGDVSVPLPPRASVLEAALPPQGASPPTRPSGAVASPRSAAPPPTRTFKPRPKAGKK